MKSLLAAIFLLTSLPAFAQHEHHDMSARQAEVAERGERVMPFNLGATTHVFIKARDGGVQRVFAKDTRDLDQVLAVREHLRTLATQFGNGDFSAPASIHGGDMPGLAQLQAAGPGELQVTYSEVVGGAQLRFRSSKGQLVTALHKWFDGQLADHGADAIAGEPDEAMPEHHQH
jgi:hypothetical protein